MKRCSPPKATSAQHAIAKQKIHLATIKGKSTRPKNGTLPFRKSRVCTSCETNKRLRGQKPTKPCPLQTPAYKIPSIRMPREPHKDVSLLTFLIKSGPLTITLRKFLYNGQATTGTKVKPTFSSIKGDQMIRKQNLVDPKG